MSVERAAVPRHRLGAHVLGLAVCALALRPACGAPRPCDHGPAACGEAAPAALTSDNASGTLRTFTASGEFDAANPFFAVLGANGRSCATCHRPEDAWSITPAHVAARFEATAGADPIFRVIDGANSPRADVATADARRAAYSMLIGKAVIRIGLPIPPEAEFTLDGTDDPYRFAGATELSLFRRPLPATNLRFQTGVMWDERETVAPFVPPMDAGAQAAILGASLRRQALNATLGHAQASMAPGEDDLRRIVAFELDLSTAQWRDRNAGLLGAADAIGGPRVLANQQFHVGINDALGADPVAAPFAGNAMRLFEAWRLPAGVPLVAGARGAIARGERVFNTRVFMIRGVAGLNDDAGLPAIAGTCSTCHDAPNVGNRSVGGAMDIGTADGRVRTPDLPLYTLRNRATGALAQTTDPGRALASGRWRDVGKFKVPALRGLAGRAPYFHNGMAASLADVVAFYELRFVIGLDAQETSDLVAFLQAL